MIVLSSVIQLIAFASVLWAISRGLVYFLIGYAVVSTLFTATALASDSLKSTSGNCNAEDDFRFGLVRVREHAEPIAFHRGEAREGLAENLFQAVYDNYKQVLRWQFKLNLFQYAHSFLTVVLPSIIIAGDVLSGDLEVGKGGAGCRGVCCHPQRPHRHRRAFRRTESLLCWDQPPACLFTGAGSPSRS